MSWTLKQHGVLGSGSGGVTTISQSISATIAHDLGVYFLTFNNNPGTITGTPSGVTSRASNTTGPWVFIYDILDLDVRSNNQVWTWTNSVAVSVEFMEWQPSATPATVDTAGINNSGTSASPATASLGPTTTADPLVLAGHFQRGSSVSGNPSLTSPTNSFSLDTDQCGPGAGSSDRGTEGVFYRTPGAAFTGTTGCTSSLSTGFANIILAYAPGTPAGANLTTPPRIYFGDDGLELLLRLEQI